MSDHDSLHRFVFEDSNVRGEIARLDSSWQAVIEQHNYPEVVRNLLGEAMAAAVLLGATIKYSGSLTIQIQGDGPVTLLVTQVNSEGSFRGVAEYSDEVKDLPLSELFGNGRLAITVEPEEEGERYQSIVGLGDGGLAEALEDYFRDSEQIDTRIWLTAGDKQAAGFLLQEMPEKAGANPNPNDDDVWNRVVYLGSTIKESELREVPVKELLHRLFNEEDIRLFDAEPVKFRCDCTRDRIEETLRSLGYDEVHEILNEQDDIEVQCSFCNQVYLFDTVDAEKIFAAGISPEVPETRH